MRLFTSAKAVLFSVFCVFSGQVLADWQLDNAASNLDFVSIKKGTAGEVHQFDRLSGHISPRGEVAIEIDLTSVNTMIDVRNQRMQEHLFETAQFAAANLTATVDPTTYEGLGVGERMDFTLPATLALHGEYKEITLEVVVIRQSPTSLLVISKKPAVINAIDFKLTDGITTLMELAKLPSIAQAVPVSFILTFTASEN